jgi:3',5'-nucleoside bisphosphate phosphatase
VLAHPANARRLEREGIAGPGELFPAYLVPGAPAYMPRSRPTVAEAIGVIHAAGGVAIWAHPFFDIGDRDEAGATLDGFVADGLDGAECFYITHEREQTEWLYGELARRELLATGSADFHGPGHEAFHAFRAFDTFGLAPRLGPIGQG